MLRQYYCNNLYSPGGKTTSLGIADDSTPGAEDTVKIKFLNHHTTTSR